jgi:excisionase family DNA binding protein
MSPKTFTTSQAAKQIGVSRQTLQTWIAVGAIVAPKLIGEGNATLRLWTKADIDSAAKYKGALRPGPKGKKKAK